MISGRAHGSSTRHSTWRPVMPMPYAASRAAGSTFWTPEYVPLSTGGTPSTTSAISDGMTKARSLLMSGAMSSTARMSRPRVGSARRPLASPATRNVPRPVCPIHIPAGMAMPQATASATREYAMCSTVRAGTPPGPRPVRRVGQPLQHLADHERAARVHGVSSRAASRMSPSSRNASSRHSTTPHTIGM